MIPQEEIKKRLHEELTASGKSQTEIAQALGIKQQSVQQYLSGRALPSLDTFANLCEILELDPAYILCLKK
ncbi:MAG: helix-turn-helix domain-containing protein [Christensenellaceae bacterium]|jgi:DNA-binding helix-turn-helix protein|nr:MAG: hypothetical protein DBY05_11440 [Clostridiales bacterium]